MRIFNATLVIISGLLILTSCNGQTGAIKINKDKIGGLYEINENGKQLNFYNSDEIFKLDTVTYISFVYFDRITRVQSDFDQGVYSLDFKLNDSGTLKFKEMTERNTGKQICFVIGDKVMSAPTILGSIPNGRGTVTVTDNKVIDQMIEYLEN
ncbi:MAG: hypothetical protein V4538_01080 [Bacteroidota bacterium]